MFLVHSLRKQRTFHIKDEDKPVTEHFEININELQLKYF